MEAGFGVLGRGIMVALLRQMGTPGLAEGDVEYVREDVLQLFCTFPQHTTWDVIWTSSLSRVDVREDPLHAVRGQLECLVGGRECPPLCCSVVFNLKPREKGVEVIW